MTRTILTVTLMILSFCSLAHAAQTVESVARIKGQEEAPVHGFGIVVGLKGTGDKPGNFKETARKMQRILNLTGHVNTTERDMYASKNVAMVQVTVMIPGSGVRSGEKLDCRIASIGDASSLKGGMLILTDLIGPIPQRPEQTLVLAQASGLVTIDNEDTPTIGKVVGGAIMRSEYRNPFIENGCITLVIAEEYASYAMAEVIAMAINDVEAASSDGDIAFPLNQNEVKVKIPHDDYVKNPVAFVSRIQNVQVRGVATVPTVYINARAGHVLIDPNVEIAPLVISHKNNVTVQPAAPAPGQEPPVTQRWVPFDVEERMGEQPNVKLYALKDALDSMKVPTEDTIEIIRSIEKQGKLIGRIKEDR